MTTGPLRKAVARALLTAAVGTLIVGGAALALAFDAIRPGVASRLYVLAGLGVAAIGLWIAHDLVTAHFRALARTEALAVGLRNGHAAGSLPSDGESDEMAAGLRDAVLTLAAERHRIETTPDSRLSAVLANVSEAVLLVTAQGQVSLVNGPAKALFGEARVAVGTSVFAALDRTTTVEAMRNAATANAPVSAALTTVDGAKIKATVTDLREHRGALICVPAATPAPNRLEHDLSLHDLPPVAPAPDDATTLDRLPVLVIDTETTGLDVAKARIVALGAVRMFGPRIFRGVMVDCLVNPGIAIPRASSAIHGIGDSMVADAPPFAEQARQILDHLGAVVVIGHNIGFDIAVLRAEAARHGVDWPEAPTLCTARLAAAFDPEEPVLDLEAVALRHGVAVEGRHTALGDSLVTAELFARMIARLADRGITTFGAARDFAASARRVVAHQRAAGW